MTIQAATDFIGRTDQDQVIRKLARERFGDIVNVGNEHGFDFTRDEFDSAMRERKATGGDPGGGEKDQRCVQTCQCVEGEEPANTCQCVVNNDGGEDEPGQTCQCVRDGGDEEPAQTCQCTQDDGSDDEKHNA